MIKKAPNYFDDDECCVNVQVVKDKKVVSDERKCGK